MTTAPPLNLPNHHTLYGSPPQPQSPVGSYSQLHYFQDSGGFRPTSQTPPASDRGSKTSSHDNTEKQTLGATSYSSYTDRTETGESLSLKPGNDEEETTTTTITTTTIITTMQSPGRNTHNTGLTVYLKITVRVKRATYYTSTDPSTCGQTDYYLCQILVEEEVSSTR